MNLPQAVTESVVAPSHPVAPPADSSPRRTAETRHLEIPIGKASLAGELTIPAAATGLVLFVHGSDGDRSGHRHRRVAEILNTAGIATLQFDLWTPEERAAQGESPDERFNLRASKQRLIAITRWVGESGETRHLGLGYLGGDTGAAAALAAAASLGALIQAVVSHGGRPDLAHASLPLVEGPTLLLVGSDDDVVLALNRQAYRVLCCLKQLTIVIGAGHLFEEPGALDEVGRMAAIWFNAHLHSRSVEAPPSSPWALVGTGPSTAGLKPAGPEEP